jgi:hypothetical protein
MTLKEGTKSSVGFLFLEVYGRRFRDMQEYDYWRNESVGRSPEELKALMEKEKKKMSETKKMIGKGTALAGPTAPILGKGVQPGVGGDGTSFATSKAGSFKPITNDFRGSMNEALKPDETVGTQLTKKSKDWMHSAKPPSVVGFGVGDKLRVTLPKSQCPTCQQKAAAQDIANKNYVNGTPTVPGKKIGWINSNNPHATQVVKPTSPVTPSPGQKTAAGTFVGNVNRSAKAIKTMTSKLGADKVNTKGV